MSEPHLLPRAPSETGRFVVDTRSLGLGRRPGIMRPYRAAVPAPAGLGLPVIGVPVGRDVEFDLRLEAVVEGVLVSGTATAPVEGECGRCLDPVTDEVVVDLQELYVYDGEPAGEDERRLAGDRLDLEPVLRDAVLLGLPLSPLCSDECAGLCAECGVRLADAGPGHRHESIDPRWAALGAFRPDETDPDDTDTHETDPHANDDETRN